MLNLSSCCCQALYNSWTRLQKQSPGIINCCAQKSSHWFLFFINNRWWHWFSKHQPKNRPKRGKTTTPTGTQIMPNIDIKLWWAPSHGTGVVASGPSYYWTNPIRYPLLESSMMRPSSSFSFSWSPYPASWHRPLHLQVAALLADADGSQQMGQAGTAGCPVEPWDEQPPVAWTRNSGLESKSTVEKHFGFSPKLQLKNVKTWSKVWREDYTNVCLDLQFSFASVFCSGAAGSGRNSDSAERSYAFSFFWRRLCLLFCWTKKIETDSKTLAS